MRCTSTRRHVYKSVSVISHVLTSASPPPPLSCEEIHVVSLSELQCKQARARHHDIVVKQGSSMLGGTELRRLGFLCGVVANR